MASAWSGLNHLLLWLLILSALVTIWVILRAFQQTATKKRQIVFPIEDFATLSLFRNRAVEQTPIKLHDDQPSEGKQFVESPGLYRLNLLEEEALQEENLIKKNHVLMKHRNFLKEIISPYNVTRPPSTLPCDDELWCNIPPPKVSHFRHSQDDQKWNQTRWRDAQAAAAVGLPLLLHRILIKMGDPNEFLNGDSEFRYLNRMADVWLSHKNYTLEDLLGSTHLREQNSPKELELLPPRKRPHNSRSAMFLRRLPTQRNMTSNNRAILTKIGFYSTVKDEFNPQSKKIVSMYPTDAFPSSAVEQNIYPIQDLLLHWKAVREKIRLPQRLVLLDGNNENWGLFSTFFPNRTVNWGAWTPEMYEDVYSMLNHPHILAVFNVQHHNLSHPKVISIPRGVPILDTQLRNILWSSQNQAARLRKTKLVLTMHSPTQWREQLLKCISPKFTKEELFSRVVHSFGDRLLPLDYYKELATSRVILTLPGLGVDTFRFWESLTLGSMPVTERGMGFDRTVWKLPVLLVDSYSDVRPYLLRQAYIEALYRVDEWEFERLTQRWWDNLIEETALYNDESYLESIFPMKAETKDRKSSIPSNC